MTRIRKTPIASTALVLAILALGLGACGDDNKSSDTGGNAATNEAIATTGTTDSTTGTTGTGTTKKSGTTGTNESKRDDKGGSGGNSGSGKSGSGNSGGGNSGGGDRKTSEELTDKNVKSTAKTVCTSFLPKALERDLKSGDKSAEDVAKDYSRAFPSAQRKDAYEGCLSGLKSKD